MVINTNVEAQRTASNLMHSQKSMAKSLSRLSSGSKIITASDDAAGLAVSSGWTPSCAGWIRYSTTSAMPCPSRKRRTAICKISTTP